MNMYLFSCRKNTQKDANAIQQALFFTQVTQTVNLIAHIETDSLVILGNGKAILC